MSSFLSLPPKLGPGAAFWRYHDDAMPRAPVLLFVSILAACARRGPSAESSSVSVEKVRAALPGLPSSLTAPTKEMDAATAVLALAETAKRLPESLASSAPDCSRARTVRDRMCELADYVCHLGGSNLSVRGRCDGASSRCEGAKETVAAQCRP
jgi:hypothetical protein